jgi:RHS repeat-associated protein
VRDITDSSGSLIDHRDYDSFGNLTNETHPSVGDRYGWTGREFDVETDLQYNRARWYDPATGRWMSQDSLGFNAGDSNLYRYVKNQPTNATDPSGLQNIWVFGALNYSSDQKLIAAATLSINFESKQINGVWTPFIKGPPAIRSWAGNNQPSFVTGVPAIQRYNNKGIDDGMTIDWSAQVTQNNAGGLVTAGTVVGGGVGLVGGGLFGTLVGPGPGTLAGAVTGAGTGATLGGTLGAGIGYLASNSFQATITGHWTVECDATGSVDLKGSTTFTIRNATFDTNVMWTRQVGSP